MTTVYSVIPVPMPQPENGVYEGWQQGGYVCFKTPQGRFEGKVKSEDCIWGKKMVTVTVKDGHVSLVAS